MLARSGLDAMVRTRRKIGWQAEAPDPPRREPWITSVGQTLSSVNPAILAIFSLFAVVPFSAQGAEPPKTWIDPDTGHRVVRLTDEPGSASLRSEEHTSE